MRQVAAHEADRTPFGQHGSDGRSLTRRPWKLNSVSGMLSSEKSMVSGSISMPRWISASSSGVLSTYLLVFAFISIFFPIVGAT